MSENETPISKANSYRKIGTFWDTHDLADYWDQTEHAEFEVDIESEITYFAVDKELSEQLQSIARKRGISPDTLINLWVREKLYEQSH